MVSGVEGRIQTNHPEEQAAVLNVIDKTHPATMHLPDRWVWTDEWYSYLPEPVADNLVDIITINEKSYDPNRMWGTDRVSAMGDYHPISWHHEFEGGRSFYTRMGHLPESYEDPLFLAHIFGGIYWAATGLGIDK